jgi:hypothetical protein
MNTSNVNLSDLGSTQESSASFKLPPRKDFSAPSATPPQARKPAVIATQLDELDSPVVAVQPPKPVEQLDPKYLTADLPSNFYFYDFDRLGVGPVLGFHQAKFSRSAKEKRTRYMVDAVSTLLPEGISAWDLTIPDFYWLLYWIRMTYYTKVQLIHTAVCKNPKHVHKIKTGELPKESLVSVHTLSKSILTERVFNPKPVEDFLSTADLSFLDNSPFTLAPSCIADIVDIEENLLEHENYAEIEYLVDYAGYLQNRDSNTPRISMQARCEFVESLTAENLHTIEQFRNLVSDYGVEESIRFTCPECRAESETKISISAHSFL